MKRSSIAVVLLLAGVVAGCETGRTGYRDAGVGITSVVGFDAARFAGTWHEVAAIGRAPGGLWQVRSGPDGALGVTTSHDGAGRGRTIGPGRFSLSQFAAPLWVLWADADMRTVVLGTPDGSFALILDRTSASSPDRLRAAREVLDWNGYDLGALS